jgi:alpha-L-arabinofuranosidase
MESALYAARLMNVFERSNNVAMSAVSDLVNGWSGGVIQASRHDVFVTPTYLVNELYAQRLGSERLQTIVASPTFDTSLEGSRVPYLDVVASRAAGGKLIYVKCVNTDPNHDLRTSIDIAGTSIAGSGTIETVNGATLSSANTFSTPHAVSLHKGQIRTGTSFVVTLPRHSVSVITLKVSN